MLVAEGGIAALWRGLGPTIARVFFGAGIYFTSIHAISDALKGVGSDSKQQSVATPRYAGEGGGAGTSGHAPPSPDQAVQRSAEAGGYMSDSARTFVAGFSARTLAATLMSPVAVVKTRMEWRGASQLPYTSTVGGVTHIARTEGVSALYAGLIPTLVRDSPFSGVYYALYSRLKTM